MRPWLARGGFFSRSSRRCETAGRARQKARASGKQNVISFPSARICTKPGDVQTLAALERDLQMQRAEDVPRVQPSWNDEIGSSRIETTEVAPAGNHCR